MSGFITGEMYQECENCEFCGSVMLIFHSEGITCSECSRVARCVTHPQPTIMSYPPEYRNLQSCEQVIKEITNRIGISKHIIDRCFVLLSDVKQIFKSKSIGDLVLVCMFQAYREKRVFISFYRLREYYPTSSSISILNDLFHKLTSSNVFILTQPYTYSEITEGLVSYFRIPNKFINLIEPSYIEISKTLKYDPIPIKLACAIQMMSIKNMFCGCVGVCEVFHFLCVKKSTVLIKIRKFKKLLTSKYDSK